MQSWDAAKGTSDNANLHCFPQLCAGTEHLRIHGVREDAHRRHSGQHTLRLRKDVHTAAQSADMHIIWPIPHNTMLRNQTAQATR